MPITPTYPGVYVEEIPSGVRTITGVSTSITAFVGYTARGPVDEAIRIFNFGDYERNFGGLHRDSLVSYAVQQFFLNGGSDAYVVRVAMGSNPAQLILKDASDANVLEIEAANDGAWGNYLRLDVDYNTSNPDSTFNLTVMSFELINGQLQEQEREVFRNLSMNSYSSSFAPRVVTSASKLIKVERSTGLTFVSSGFSLSGKLDSFSLDLSQENTISGILDGEKQFTLALNGTGTISDLDALLTAVDTAITTAGLTARLEASKVDALGGTSGSLDYLKLESSATTEKSSVKIVKAAANDASATLKLGLANGGREKEGASVCRPMPNGTISGDLADIWKPGTIGLLTITVAIKDNSTGTPTDLFTPENKTIPAGTVVGPDLRDKLQEKIREINHPAAKQAVVELNGTFLRVIPSANTPNASIEFTGADAGEIKLLGDEEFVNVQQYSVGIGPAVLAQGAAVPGSDGTPPGAAEIIGSYNDKTGIYALRDADLFNILAIPRTTILSDAEAKSVISAAISFCEDQRAFYILDPDPLKTNTDIADWISQIGTYKNAAVFFPQVKLADPLDGYRLKKSPPSGSIAGSFARTDAQRGVWKAPAGLEASLRGVQALDYKLTDQENGALNPLGINCIRTFPVYGTVIWGSRTLEGADQMASEWKYIPVRRLALFIEESLYRGTQWVVFEPNDEPLWSQIRLNVGAFMHRLFRQGAFQGATPKEAYLVKCDKETTPQADINLGIVNILVGFAPLKPAEFVFIKIQQMAGQIET